MSLFGIFKKKQSIDTEGQRRDFLLAHGRITEGSIVDCETADNGAEIIYYIYNIQGVDFESSEIMTAEQLRNPLKYAPGAKVGIRFDPKNHGNSILV